MTEPKLLLICSFVLMCAGTGFGYIVIEKLAGQGSAQEFLTLGTLLVSSILSIQILFFCMASRRLLYLLVFTSISGLAMVWYMMCFATPIYWLPKVSGTAKLMVFAVSAFLIIGNGFEGLREFKRQWQKNEPDVMKHFDKRLSVLDWHKVAKSLHLSASIYVPGVSKDIAVLLSLPLFLSMMFGFSFIKVYPVASVFAWGIPFIMMAACFTQFVTMGIAQVFKVIEIEKKLGVRISPKLG